MCGSERYSEDMRALSIVVVLLLMGLVPATQSACDDVEPRLVVSGFPIDSVDIDSKALGVLDDTALAAVRADRGIDGVLRLPDGSCTGGCRFAELSVYVTNTTPHALAPPVVRTRAIEGRPARAPLAFGVKEISPGRTGRIRVVVELWPEERALEAHLSSSVFVAVN
jgi:hypothetical protein